MIYGDDTVLFQGDSITACSRNVEQAVPNAVDGLGHGYVLHASTSLLCDIASDRLKIFNRGVSGNRLENLAARWQQDCIDLRPTVVSILIGINDVVRHLGQSYEAYAGEFELRYRALLHQTVDALPKVRLIICEPFAFQHGEVTADWNPILSARRATAKHLADEFGAKFVPFQSAFDYAARQTEISYLGPDGVHPTLAGHKLMARCWLDSIVE